MSYLFPSCCSEHGARPPPERLARSKVMLCASSMSVALGWSEMPETELGREHWLAKAAKATAMHDQAVAELELLTGMPFSHAAETDLRFARYRAENRLAALLPDAEVQRRLLSAWPPERHWTFPVRLERRHAPHPVPSRLDFSPQGGEEKGRERA